jgi:hypothetical protein
MPREQAPSAALEHDVRRAEAALPALLANLVAQVRAGR